MFLIFIIISAAFFGWSSTLNDVIRIFARVFAWSFATAAVAYALGHIHPALAILGFCIVAVCAIKQVFFTGKYS